jgi:DNA-binding NtrC family response regulator
MTQACSEGQAGLETIEVKTTLLAGPWVLELDGPAGIARLELEGRDELVLGSSEAADLRIADPTISARHLRIRVLPCGVQLEDLASTNGLFVGSAKVVNALLTRPDTRFVVGQTTVVLRRSGELVHAQRSLVPGLVGNSPAMRRLAESIVRIAPLSAPVLIEGESGTGKDVVARALHKLSKRAGGFVPLNCSSLQEGLADSELFGHCRGAFTGAVNQRVGAFQQANQGTLFLDEIAELAPMVQAKLLRVIEDGEVRPVGGTVSTQVSTRLVCATWRSLSDAAARGKFRNDLLHRIGTIVLRVPPLRQRRGDIPALCTALLERMKGDVGDKELTHGAIEYLCGYDWPGNVRELRSVLYRAAVDSDGVEIDLSQVCLAVPSFGPGQGNPLDSEQVRRLLDQAGGNVTKAARLAKVARSTFRSWLLKAEAGGAQPASKPAQAEPTGPEA